MEYYRVKGLNNTLTTKGRSQSIGNPHLPAKHKRMINFQFEDRIKINCHRLHFNFDYSGVSNSVCYKPVVL